VIILGGLLGLLLGLLLVALLRLVAPVLFPPQGGLYPHYYVGLLPSNPDGTFARRDYWLMALVSFAGTMGCLLLLFGVSWIFDGLSAAHSTKERLTEGLVFSLCLLALLSFGAAVTQASRALWWQPRRLACDWSPSDAMDDQ
jgi:hypothetical protein